MWHMGNSLAGQWLGLGAFTTVAWVQSLVRELISCKSWGMSDKRKKKKMTCGRYILRSCLFPPSNLNESLVGYEILAWKLFSLRTSKALFLYILTSRIATKESDTILVLHVISSLSLRTFILYPQNSAISLISINIIVVSHLYSLYWAFVEPIQSENILQESFFYIISLIIPWSVLSVLSFRNLIS